MNLNSVDDLTREAGLYHGMMIHSVKNKLNNYMTYVEVRRIAKLSDDQNKFYKERAEEIAVEIRKLLNIYKLVVLRRKLIHEGLFDWVDAIDKKINQLGGSCG